MIPLLDLLLSVIWFAALLSAVQRREPGRWVLVDGRKIPVNGG